MAFDLHIAVDCRVVDPHYPGIGRAVLEAARAMARDLAHDSSARRLSLLVGPGVPPAALAELFMPGRVALVPVGARLRAPADQWALPRALSRLRPDVYHAPYYAVPAVVPVPLVLTVHDMIPQLFPQYWPNRALRTTIDLWTRHAIHRADRIIAVSHSTAADLARLIPSAAAKTRVVPQGVSPRSLPDVKPADPPYLLYVGSNKPHKNLPRLVAAFARQASETLGDLVIAGAWDDHYPEARDEARRRGLDARVRFEHRPSDRRLDELFAGATAFVFPSLYEGFGLPVLEAMAAGLPVATSGCGSLGEVAGDAALLFDPKDETAMAAAIGRLLGDEELRARLTAAGYTRAALFPWSRTAAGLWDVYAEAAASAARA